MQLIENLLGSKTKIKVLRKFVQNRDWTFNLTELSKDLDINKGNLSRVLGDFEKEKIVSVVRKGRIKLFKLDLNDKFVKDLLIPLFELEERIFQSVEERLKTIDAESTVLYGSFARKEARPCSDIDVMVLVRDKKDVGRMAKKVEKLSEEFLEENLILFVDVMAVSEFKKLYERDEPLIKKIVKEGKVLSGKDTLEVIR
ncbi:MAG: nucleotidyltransferase domain-containing protein [Methanosarcinales archaeon]|nr:MAG: nucleotidyltransferase domain-containing protein [Methanosarcinales archaeon]